MLKYFFQEQIKINNKNTNSMPFCRFCYDNKIAGPHNHFLRESKDPQSKVTCPLLLNTNCLKCSKKGHTAKYCKLNVMQYEKKEKDSIEYDEDGFAIVKAKKKIEKKETSEYFANNKNQNNFAILCQEEECEDEDITSNITDTNTTSIKTDTSSTSNLFYKRPTGMSWADWEEED